MKMQLFQDFLNLLFPRVCAACSRPLNRVEQQLCLHCEQELPLIIDHQEQQAKLAGRLPFKAIYSLLKFKPKGMVQKLLHEIKYQNNKELAEMMGRRLANEYFDDLVQLNLDLIIPVPLHPSKLRKRGYNQSTYISNGISEKLEIPSREGIIIRTQKSETQTRKTRSERWQNVSQIFTLADNAKVDGLKVLIVDDVFTTGATLEACGQQFVDGGATVAFATLASA